MAAIKAHRNFLLLPFLLFSFCLYAQTGGSFSLKKYTVKDGLPDSYIFHVFQDSRGFLWIGTPNGISRFDGKNFSNYGFSNQLPSLATDFICEDKDHQIWAGTRAGCVQLKGNTFHEYPLSDSALISFVFGMVTIAGKELWMLTTKGVYRFENDHWQKIKLYPGLENNPCRQVIATANGIYINYGNYLVLRHNDGRFELLEEKPGSWPYFNQLKIFGGELYVSTPMGLYRIINNRLVPFFTGELAKKRLAYFFRDSQKRFWVVTDEDGLLMVKMDSSGEKIAARIPVAFSLVSHIFEDRDNNVWVACFDGLGKIVQQQFSTFQAPADSSISDIRNILQNSDGTILAFSQGNGFLTFKDNHFSPSSFSFTPAGKYLLNSDILDTYSFGPKGELWFTTRQKKLLCLYKKHITDNTPAAGKTLDLYNVCWSNASGQLFVAADSLLTGNEKRLRPFAPGNNSRRLFQPIASHCFSNGLQIVSTRNDGSFLIDPENNLIDITAALGIKKSIIGFHFLEEKNGNFWIYKNTEGLRRYQWTKGLLPKKNLEITTSNGLPNNTVVSMCIDKYNRLWVSSLAGLAILRIDTLNNNQPVFYNPGYNIDVAPELPAETKLIAATDGMVWLSTPSKIYRFNPDDIQFRNISPSISIEKIKLLTEKADTLLNYFWQSQYPVSFSYDKNSFQVTYTGIAFNNSFELQYSYKLNGLDSNWSIPTSNNNVSYVNLPSGDYTFEVKVKKADSDWSKPALFVFTIQKPLWETWWFRMLTVLTASAVIITAFRYRVNEVKTKAALKNKLQDLESKALKAQMNPHFIFNAMNSIQSLIINNRTEEAGNYISKFARLMRQVFENSDNNLVTISKELHSLQLYIALEKLRLDVNLSYSEDIDPDIDIFNEKIPSLLLQPFIENALWHGLSKKEGSKILALKITASGSFITCEIIDNGIGRSMAAQHYHQQPEGHLSKATQITKDRLLGFNQDKSIEPLKIIDLKDNAGQPAGTAVQLHIKRTFTSR